MLYGSGGCTLYDAAKLAALGGFDPAVRDGVCGGSGFRRARMAARLAQRVLRATLGCCISIARPRRATSRRSNSMRFWSEFRSVSGAVRRALRSGARISRGLRSQGKIGCAASRGGRSPRRIGRIATTSWIWSPATSRCFPESRHPGGRWSLIASPYLPFPLSHGAAVRIYNLMRRAAADFDHGSGHLCRRARAGASAN